MTLKTLKISRIFVFTIFSAKMSAGFIFKDSHPGQDINRQENTGLAWFGQIRSRANNCFLSLWYAGAVFSFIVQLIKIWNTYALKPSQISNPGIHPMIFVKEGFESLKHGKVKMWMSLIEQTYDSIWCWLRRTTTINTCIHPKGAEPHRRKKGAKTSRAGCWSFPHLIIINPSKISVNKIHIIYICKFIYMIQKHSGCVGRMVMLHICGRAIGNYQLLFPWWPPPMIHSAGTGVQFMQRNTKYNT